MNKKEFVDELSERTGLTKKDSREVLDESLDIITEALQDDEDVMFTGFGKFENRTRQSTTGRNPQTGEKMKIPAKIMPKFKAGKNLKEGVQEELDIVEDAAGDLHIRS